MIPDGPGAEAAAAGVDAEALVTTSEAATDDDILAV